MNFYGFRKIKTEPIRINPLVECIESRYWRFRHEKFLRGRPDLLCEIKKASQQCSADQQEVNDLKRQVSELQDQVLNFTSELRNLSRIVEELRPKTNIKSVDTHESSLTKKRKVEPTPDTSSSSMITNEQSSVSPGKTSALTRFEKGSFNDSAIYTDADLLIEDDELIDTTSTIDLTQNKFPPPYSPGDRSTSISSFAMTSLGTMNEMFGDDMITQYLHEQSDPNLLDDLTTTDEVVRSDTNKTENIAVDREQWIKLRRALSTLPQEMQVLFVERMIALISDPEKYKNQVEAVTALAVVAAGCHENSTDAIINSGLSLSLATATLGSFICQFGEAKNNQQQNRPVQ